jgi:hypothetical protein
MSAIFFCKAGSVAFSTVGDVLVLVRFSLLEELVITGCFGYA